MKRTLALLLAACMLCALLPVTASAAEQTAPENRAENCAEALYDLGLFRGTGTHNDGSPEFQLGSKSTRAEAITMLVRLLGREEEARKGVWTTPFTDVPDWAGPYVGYAYANGLTMGTDPNHGVFGSTEFVTVSQYLTFVLRALGYESGKDFKWDTAWELSDKLGLTAGEYTGEGEFLRGDLAIISYSTLFTACKNSTRTMLETLTESGAVDLNAADGLKFYRVLDAVSAEHKAAVTAPIDTSALSRYTVNDSSTANLLTDSEIRALLEPSAHQAAVTRAQAQSDVDLFFRMLRSAYCAYYYFGPDRFEAAEKNVQQWLAQFSTVDVTDLERKIADEMSFARDAHAIFGTAPDESSARYEYFYVKDLRLYKGEDGYYKLDNGEKWYLKDISDDRAAVELTLMDDGELVYAPVLLVPGTEVKSCTISFGIWEGSYRLIPMLDGKPITDYTYTNADKSVIQDRLLDDGTVEVTVVGYGSAKLTFTVNGKNYSFYWSSHTP